MCLENDNAHFEPNTLIISSYKNIQIIFQLRII